MPLTHVCVWDAKAGYRRVTIDEASEMYPYGVSAQSGIFVCELCAQNVCLTSRGVNAQHFRHDSAAESKDCEERAQAYSSTLTSLNSHPMPIRIVVNEKKLMFYLQLGFFSPARAGIDHFQGLKIRITGDYRQTYEYSIERIEGTGITYLSVGNLPSTKYNFIYDNATVNLERYWPACTMGINPRGSFFDCCTGKLIFSGGKAYCGKDYYLLQRGSCGFVPRGIKADKITTVQTDPFISWTLYKIHVSEFCASTARFFLQRAVFLTETATIFYPVWPVCVEDPYFIYHDESIIFFYLIIPLTKPAAERPSPERYGQKDTRRNFSC